MQLTITERDKKLLIVLAVFVMVIGLGAGLIIPFMNKGQELSEKLDNEKITKQEMEMKIQTLPALQDKTEGARENLNQQAQHFYSLMGSMQIDKMLTESMLAKGVTVKDLDIVMPKETEYTTLNSYLVTQTDFLGQTAKTSSDSVAKGDGTTYDGVYTASVSLMLTGNRENLQKALDEFAATEPKIRITDFTWGSNRNEEESGDSLSVSLELYMVQDIEEYLGKLQNTQDAAEDKQNIEEKNEQQY